MRHALTLILTILLGVSAAGAAVDTMTGVMHPGFRSLQVRPVDAAGVPYEGPPIIDLGSGQRIAVTFDELDDDRRFMRYELIHCDALWRPEGLVDTEFLDGFNQADVTDYAFSQGTLAHYVNYRIDVPNKQLAPSLSGNYLLRVYPEDDPDVTLLQARFSVSENTADVAAECTSRTDFDYNGSHQQLSVAVDTERLRINDPYTDLRLVVEQDGRTDNAVALTNPLRMKGHTAIFEHNRDLTFDAGNEYRRFESINDYYPGMGVAEIVYADPLYHTVLYTDAPRAGADYAYDLWRGGRYLVRRQNTSDSDTEADYVVVHFSLDMPYQPDYDIYIEGDLTNRRLDTESLMVYNPESGLYEKALLLKQGAYSYQYVAVDRRDSTRRGLTGVVEGDYYPTQHAYTVRAYYRRPGERYDRLAGWREIYSIPQ